MADRVLAMHCASVGGWVGADGGGVLVGERLAKQ